MFALKYVVWILLLPRAVLNVCHRTYNIAERCDVTYGNVLETRTVRSLIECHMLCSMLDSCLTIKYNSGTRSCQLNSERYPSQGVCSENLIYAMVTKRSCGKLIDDVCSDTSECSVINSRCYLGLCRCNPGYSYKYINETCVTSCEVYGETYTVHAGYYLKDHNTKTLFQVSSGKVCQSKCTTETAFICRTVDFAPQDYACHLSVATALTEPNILREAFNLQNVMFHRNCQ